MSPLLLCLALVACDDGGDAEAPADVSTDAQDAGAPDLGADAALDLGPDAAPDAQADLGPDAEPAPTLDETLAEILAMQEVPVEALEAPVVDDALYDLGQALFFDPVLSGNKDTACATCHHPSFALGDGLSLSAGTGARGHGPVRGEGEHRPFVARNAPDLSNRGDPAWRHLFWDGRVQEVEGVLQAPEALPEGLSGVLAAQALFPLLSPAEMLGLRGELDLEGQANELAGLEGADAVWAGIVARLLAIPEYAERMRALSPEPDIALVANAIAAFEARAFAFTDTDWDRYLRGDLEALLPAAKLGAIVFYEGALCGACHSGALLTDQKFHNIGVVQLGPGHPDNAPYDHGRENVTGDASDRFAFRTAPLRNVLATAPFMHNGAFLDLNRLLQHYARPTLSAGSYDDSMLHPDLVGTAQQSEAHLDELVDLLSQDLLDGIEGRTTVGLSNIRQFLEALVDPARAELESLIPESVPSGLAVGGR